MIERKVKLELKETSLTTLVNVKLLVDREEWKVFARDAAEKLRQVLIHVLPKNFVVFFLLSGKYGYNFGLSWPYIILPEGKLENTVLRIIKEKAESLGIETEKKGGLK